MSNTNRFKIPIAHDKDKNIVLIENAQRKTNYYCAGCGGTCGTKLGNRISHHFYHLVNPNDINSCNESAMHLKGKYDILTSKKISFKSFGSDYNLDLKDIQLEKSVENNKFRIDVFAKSDSYDFLKGKDLWIEVVVSSDLSKDKFEFIQENENIVCLRYYVYKNNVEIVNNKYLELVFLKGMLFKQTSLYSYIEISETKNKGCNYLEEIKSCISIHEYYFNTPEYRYMRNINYQCFKKTSSELKNKEMFIDNNFNKNYRLLADLYYFLRFNANKFDFFELKPKATKEIADVRYKLAKLKDAFWKQYNSNLLIFEAKEKEHKRIEDEKTKIKREFEMIELERERLLKEEKRLKGFSEQGKLNNQYKIDLDIHFRKRLKFEKDNM